MNRVAQDLMATIQDELELYLIRTVKAMQTEEFALYHLPHPGAKNLCLSGGCSLNVQANSRLLNEKVVSNLYIPPAVSDCGVSIGAALYLWHHILDNKFEGVTWHSPYLGDTLYNAPPHFRIGCSNDVYGQNKHNEFEEFMEKYPTIVYKMKSEEEIIHGTAKLLAEGKIIAWAQGRAEIGPRALGNRSILCHPGYIKTERTPNFHSEYWHNGGCLTKGTMKDIINEKVKHREFWRPFAPIALWPDCVNYFELDHPSPYMLESPMGRCWGTERVVRWVPKWKDVCSTVHVDGTCRVQTVTDETNPLMFKLLTKFKEFSGLPVLLNTSLNDRGKPIANTLEDILNLLRDTELDYAIVDNWIFSKK
jgi:carbamoyltransferase